MFRLTGLVIALMACTLLVQAVSIQYSDCPKDCKCVKNLMASIMTCKKMFTENLVGDIPITHFELTGTDVPFDLSENIFEKMGLKHVNVISISNGHITTIDKNAFKGLKELTQIELMNMKISKLHPDTFKIIPNLKTLKLAGNPLDKNVVIMSENLEQLVISKCKLSEVSQHLFENLPSVTFLDLSDNNIEKLDTGVFDKLVDLQEINLSSNLLKQIPKDLFINNEILNTLNLSSNPLVTFSGEELDDLETLDLKSCLITQIDSTMFKDMDHLGNLDLSYNKISSIDPKAFNSLTELSVIDLSGNDLHVLDDNVFSRNSNLQKIRLDNNNQLTKLPVFNAIGYHFGVHYFSCINCNLRVLSTGTFKDMPGLVTLLLSHNKIIDVSTRVFQNLTSLIEVDLSYNEITTFDDETFKGNSNLQKLLLSFNPLKALHATMFKDNINLKILEISSCGLFKLWTASTGTLKLPSILSLNISNNNIKIIAKEDVAVTNHLKSLDISKNPLTCNDDLKNLIIYLNKHEIKNTQYLTHEKQSYDFEDRDNNLQTWKDIAKQNCPDLLPDGEDEDDAIDDDDDEDFEDTTHDDISYDTIFPTFDNNDYQVSEVEQQEIEENPLPVKHYFRFHYSIMWPILIFIVTALAVLGLVVNVILFIIRRKQSLPIPRIIQVPKISSRLKTNSGLVYQQLSEEHGPKTPILGRFTPIPSIHGHPTDAEHV